MKDKNPKFSILCPIRNVAPYIKDMAESALSQTYEDWELIIMDGASTDGTVKIIMDYAKKDKRIRAYSEPDESPWHAVDKMFGLARGEYITIVCGQDGFLDKEWLKKCNQVFEKDKNISLVWALTQGVSEAGEIIDDKDAYSHFINKESRKETVKNALVKGLKLLRDLIFADYQRKKFIISKVFSKSAFLTVNTFTNRQFPNDQIPQKEDWFNYWLQNGMVFPDQSMVISKKVFLNCVPRYKMGSRTLGHMTDFYYNFNSKGYLAYFIPTHAIFGRMHEDASGQRKPDEMFENALKYLNKVRDFRKKLQTEHKRFPFVDKDGQIVSSRQF